MKKYKILILLLFVSYVATSCYDDLDDEKASIESINDFVWRGMNRFYLYKDNVPNLANNKFSNNETYKAYLNSFSEPKDLFESLIYRRESVDPFSWFVDNYFELESYFDGIAKSNGMEFQVFRFGETDTNRYGIVTYVLPNTSAEANGLKRGDIFYGINNITLNKDNIRSLLSTDSYTINLGVYNDNSTPEVEDDSVTPTSEIISLTKTQYEENPILIDKIIESGGKKIAYLMYNSFTGTDQFNANLNTVFNGFKSANATELILDLRYNSGGSVRTAIILSSLITGQFTGDVFSKEQWNEEFQQYFINNDPEALLNRFVDNNNGETLHSLNLNRLYVLTTKRSASASELVINSLRPYINVIQIGDVTAGKYQASTTLYDSHDFRRRGANITHTYAIQPLIYKSLNVEGVTDYFNGLTPDIILKENVTNLGVLGEETEPLLARAISHINGILSKFSNQKENYIDILNTDISNLSTKKGMHTTEEELPQDLIKKIFLEQ